MAQFLYFFLGTVSFPLQPNWVPPNSILFQPIFSVNCKTPSVSTFFFHRCVRYSRSSFLLLPNQVQPPTRTPIPPPPRIPLLTDRDIPKEFPSRRKSDYFRSNLHLTHSLCWASFTRQRQFPPWSARFPPVPIDLATHLRQNHILKRQANGPLLPAAPNKSPGRRSLIDLPSPARPPNLVSPTELALSSFLPSQPPIPIQAGILQRAFSQGLADAHRRQRGPAWRTFRDDRARPATSEQ